MKIMLGFEKLELDYPERALLVYTSRITITDAEKEKIRRLVNSKKINWYEFAKYALFHKTIVLCWKNINEICSSHNIPKYLDDAIRYMYACNKLRNSMNLEQRDILKKKCTEKGIICIPVKGAYLMESLYGDYGVRYSGDMDFLVRYDDIEELKKVLNKMGYVNGTYSKKDNKILPLSRGKELMWKMYMSNLAPYIKLSENQFFHYYKFDFRYALDDSLNKEPIREIIEKTIKNGFTMPSHYLVHLCTHFYDEAKHVVTIAMFKDVNMIKLCDIREFILKYISDKDLIETIEFCNRHNLNEALYYTIFFLEKIYGDGYEKKILDMIQIDDKTFLNTFGDSTIDNTFTYQKDIIERFFSCGNVDELIEKPKYFEEV